MSLCSGRFPASGTRGPLASTRPRRAPILESIAFRFAIGWV